MGASSWQYFVPYQTDMYKALLELRRQVFESGDYHEPYLQPISDFLEEWEGMLDNPRMSPENSTRMKELWGRLSRGADAETVEDKILEMLARSYGSCSHSILDMDFDGELGAPGQVKPLPEEALEKCFGTKMPTRADIDLKKIFHDNCIEIHRWDGYYFNVYTDGTLSEICFLGVSGD